MSELMFGGPDANDGSESCGTSVVGEKSNVDSSSGELAVVESDSKANSSSSCCANNPSKILIEVNLSKPNLQEEEISKIIRDIFGLNDQDLEVEKVVMPIGEKTWHIKKKDNTELFHSGSGSNLESGQENQPVMSKKKKRFQQCRMKLIKQNKMVKIKLPHTLNRSRHGFRKKEKDSNLKLDMNDVHTSPGITNLLSQLYPNPYNLINLLEVQDLTAPLEETELDKTTKVKFKNPTDLTMKESDVDQEILSLITESLAIISSSQSAELEKETAVQYLDEIPPGGDAVVDITFSGMNMNVVKNKNCSGIPMNNRESVKDPVLDIPSSQGAFRFYGDTRDEKKSEIPKEKVPQISELSQRSENCYRVMFDNAPKLEKTGRKRPARSLSTAIDYSDSLTRRKHIRTAPVPKQVSKQSSICNIHPMSRNKPNYSGQKKEKKTGSKSINNKWKLENKWSDEWKGLEIELCPKWEPKLEKMKDRNWDSRSDKYSDRASETSAKCQSAPGRAVRSTREENESQKKKTEIQYLKLIKDMFEAEERELQGRIDNALNLVMQQLEKPLRKTAKVLPSNEPGPSRLYMKGELNKNKTPPPSRSTTPTRVSTPTKPSAATKIPTPSRIPTSRARSDLRTKKPEKNREETDKMVKRFTELAEKVKVDESVATDDELIPLGKEISMKSVEVTTDTELTTENEPEIEIIEVIPETFPAAQVEEIKVEEEPTTAEEPTVVPVNSIAPNNTFMVKPVEMAMDRMSFVLSETSSIYHSACSSVDNSSGLSINRSYRSPQIDLSQPPMSSFGQCLVQGIDLPVERKPEKPAEGMRFDIINRSAEETNRKIDFLIKHIDNSMNWLSQSDRSDSTTINSIIEKARELSDKLEKNLRTCKAGTSGSEKDSLRLYENKNMSYKRSDMLLGQSYHSLHIFPTNNGIGSLRISTDNMAVLNNPRSKDYLLWRSNMLRPNSMSSIFSGRSRYQTPSNSFYCIKQGSGGGLPTVRDDRTDSSIIDLQRGGNNLMIRSAEPSVSRVDRREEEEQRAPARVNRTRSFLESEVPELPLSPRQTVISVESSNELGGFQEAFDQSPRRSNESLKNRKKFDANLLKSALETEEMLLHTSSHEFAVVKPDTNAHPSSLSFSVVAVDESSTGIKSSTIEEVLWNSCISFVLPPTQVRYRCEDHVLMRMKEATVLHVARKTLYRNTVMRNVIRVIEQELRQQSSVIISLHKCSSFMRKNNLHDAGKICQFVVLPKSFNELSSGLTGTSDEEPSGEDVKVIKKQNVSNPKERHVSWDSYPSESSTETRLEPKKPDTLLPRSKKIDPFMQIMGWSQPDPYESNPGDDDSNSRTSNLHALRSGPQPQDERREAASSSKGWENRKVKFEGVAPLIFRYLSSETSNTSVEIKKEDLDVTGEPLRKPKKAELKFFPDVRKPVEEAKTHTDEPEDKGKGKYEDDDDTSSTSSFKSSNDCSDMSQGHELSFPKKKTKARKHFLDKLFHELRSFRRTLLRRRGPRRKEEKDGLEFEDAVSELQGEGQQEVQKPKEYECVKLDDLVLPVPRSPRKIFKTSFRGKESVTELMIDLKDISISEVSDICVEKKKISTDHTKISIVISKQGDEEKELKENPLQESVESSFQSFEDAKPILEPDVLPPLEQAREEDSDDDEDYYSVASSTHSQEKITKIEEDEEEEEEIPKPPWQKTFGSHKFDFYKKMDGTGIDLHGRELIFNATTNRYDVDLDTLRKTLRDMQHRVRNIKKTSYYTSGEYYERALKMANMSAGYCQSCKSRTVIPKDPFGFYKKLMPRSSGIPRPAYTRQGNYYFRTTSSTNSSFYSIHSSNSDISDNYCQLNSSSSIVTDGLTTKHQSVLRGSTNQTMPFVLGRTFKY